MTGLGVWLFRAVFSAAYWLGCLYLATGMFVGDRITSNGIVPSTPMLPPWVFALLALLIYASLSLAWDRWTDRRTGR